MAAIAVDFDGTVVTHEYPFIGKNIGAVPVLKDLIKNGHKIILNTMRSGDELAAAVQWFNENDIKLYGINENPDQYTWTNSPKIYAQIYIDDHNFGCPLTTNNEKDIFVDWITINDGLYNMGYLTAEQKDTNFEIIRQEVFDN